MPVFPLLNCITTHSDGASEGSEAEATAHVFNDLLAILWLVQRRATFINATTLGNARWKLSNVLGALASVTLG